MTRTFPFRRTILQELQIRFTLARTFITLTYIRTGDRSFD